MKIFARCIIIPAFTPDRYGKFQHVFPGYSGFRENHTESAKIFVTGRRSGTGNGRKLPRGTADRSTGQFIYLPNRITFQLRAGMFTLALPCSTVPPGPWVG